MKKLGTETVGSNMLPATSNQEGIYKAKAGLNEKTGVAFEV